MALSHDVNVWKLAIRKNRKRGHGVRWSVAGHEFSKRFTTHALADNHRTGLLQAVRKGEAFDTETGLPKSAVREHESVTSFDLACRFVDLNTRALPVVGAFGSRAGGLVSRSRRGGRAGRGRWSRG